MNYQEISYLIMIGVFSIYIILTYISFGTLPSISDSFYKLESFRKGLGREFQLWTGIVALSAMISCEHWSITLAGTGLILVGSAPYFKVIINAILHYLGAGLAIIGTQIYIAIVLFNYGHNTIHYLSPLIFIEIALVIYFNCSNRIWWIEIVAFLMFFLVQGLNLFIL